jgi:nucleoside phosphorylase
MVGIAGGVWHPDTDVRLGDVVVGVHPKSEAGVVQYDYGRQIQDKAFIMTGSMNKAPDLLLNAVAAVQAVHSVIDETEMEYVAYLEQNQATKFSKRPVQDRLFSSTYVHPSGSCDDCDKQQLRDRPQRTHPMIPKVHYGPIASGNRLIRDPDFAEAARKKYSILCRDGGCRT